MLITVTLTSSEAVKAKKLKKIQQEDSIIPHIPASSSISVGPGRSPVQARLRLTPRLRSSRALRCDWPRRWSPPPARPSRPRRTLAPRSTAERRSQTPRIPAGTEEKTINMEEVDFEQDHHMVLQTYLWMTKTFSWEK